MKTEPLWRLVLNWGCVFYFLALPALTIFIGFSHIQIFEPGSRAPQFLANFHLTISALVATMAGLNSFDRHKVNGKQETEKNNAPKE
jgi:hypothetical protein